MPIALPLQWRDPQQWVFLCAGSFVRGISCFMRYIGVYCVGAGMLLIFLMGGLLMYAIIPIMAETTLELICHVVVAMVLLFNIYFNYALCCATDPGVITSKWKEETHDEATVDIVPDDYERQEGMMTDRDVANVDEEVLPRIRPTAVTLEGKKSSRLVPVSRVQLLDPHSVARQRSGNESSYCRRCRHFRPRRAHHCSVCNRCIAHLDHHCPWVNNCIGRNNYRYFFTFLVWLAVGAFYAAYLSYSAVYAGLSHEQFMRLLVIFETHSPTVILTFAFTISSSGGVAVSILATWHAFLIVTAQTSVEWRINRRLSHKRLYGGKGVSPYSSGSIHGNWEQVFGRCDLKILSLMPSTRRIPKLQVLDKETKRITHDVVDSERATPFDDIV